MIARVLRLLLVLQLLAVAGLSWAALRAWQGRPGAPVLALACGLGAPLLVRALITLHHFWLSWRHGSATPPAYRLSAAARWRLVCGEFAATMLASSWSMAWPRLAPAPQVSAADGLPVLLLHGYACNRGYWSRLSRLLTAVGIAHAALDLEPPGAAIDDYAGQVHAALAALGPGPAVIVAHSMGGLVARAYLRRYGAGRVARVITLGTPHHGTVLARLGPGRNAAQMRHASAWLTALAATESRRRRALFTSIYSHHDNIVIPQTSSCLPGAKNIAFGAVGHVALGRAPQILRCVLAEIALATGAARAQQPARRA